MTCNNINIYSFIAIMGKKGLLSSVLVGQSGDVDFFLTANCVWNSSFEEAGLNFLFLDNLNLLCYIHLPFIHKILKLKHNPL